MTAASRPDPAPRCSSTGCLNTALWDYIRRNSRAARQLQDDLDAQIASARLGVRRFNELLDRYGMDTVLTATRQLMDDTERVLRQRIAEIPDGEYRAEGFLDDNGRNRDVRLPIKVCVRVKGGGIEIDLTGSADHVETGFNVPFRGGIEVTGELNSNGTRGARATRTETVACPLGAQIQTASEAAFRSCAAELLARAN